MSDYQKAYQEEKQKQLVLWEDMISKVFGEKPNDSVKVTERNRMIDILEMVGKSKALNHTFMPSGGGLDLSGARFSNEQGLAELNFGGSDLLVRPDSLSFHPIGDSPEWWYFRLDTLPFEESGVYEKQDEDSAEEVFKTASDKELEWIMSYYGEEVLEVEPGKYIDRAYWDINHLGYDENGDEIPLPEHARVVSRMYNGGAFVIFPKLSAYNQVSSTYDARHNKVNDEEFKSYISEIVKELIK
ncbi:serine/threonine protein kinase [Rossellomorea marisflavi]|uniref:serine/threonine protein kinase n=1 Tax=Rossellomorea marisflavi TaxID=189381 RepID=UPI00345A85DB